MMEILAMRNGFDNLWLPGGPLFEGSNAPVEVPDWACDELARYNRDAGRKLGLGPDNPFSQFKPSGSTVLYRGLGFDPVDGASILKKMRLKAQVGATGVYKTGKVQSWTTDEKEAEGFAGKFSIAGRDDASLGLVLKLVARPDDIRVPVGNLPPELKKKCLHFDQNEFLLEPGSYSVQVVNLLGAWPDETGVKTDMAFKKELPAIANDLMTKTGGSGVGRNWNKTPGFAVNYRKFSPDGKFEPSLHVMIEPDNEVRVEIMGFKKIGSNASNHRIKFDDRSAMQAYFRDGGFASDFMKTYKIAAGSMGESMNPFDRLWLPGGLLSEDADVIPIKKKAAKAPPADDDSWLDKRVKNPETGNMVKVRSLSPPDQERYRQAHLKKLAKANPAPVDPVRAQQAQASADMASKAVEKVSGGNWSVKLNDKGKQVWVHKSGREFPAPKKASFNNLDKHIAAMDAAMTGGAR